MKIRKAELVMRLRMSSSTIPHLKGAPLFGSLFDFRAQRQLQTALLSTERASFSRKGNGDA